MEKQTRPADYLAAYLRYVLLGGGGVVTSAINLVSLVGGLTIIGIIAALTQLDVASLAVGLVAFLVLFVVTHLGPFLAYQDERRKRAIYESRPRPVYAFTREWVDQREIEEVPTAQVESLWMGANYVPREGVMFPPTHRGPSTEGLSWTGTDLVRDDFPSPPPKAPYFAHVEMSNDPPIEWKCVEADATGVYATLQFFRLPEDTPLFGPIAGRWSDAVQPAAQSRLASIDGMSETDFKSNGKPHDLDIAIKHPDDQICYAFSSASFFAPRGCRSGWELVGDEFRVEVTLKGHGTDEVVNYRLCNRGRGDGMTIERRDVEPVL